MADDLSVLRIRGHPVPESRREGRRACLDDGMKPLGHGAIRFPHLGDLREYLAFPTCLVRGRLQLFDALLHRASFLVGEFRDGSRARGGLLLGLHCWFPLSHRVRGQALAARATFPCWRIRMALPKGSRMPMSVP